VRRVVICLLFAVASVATARADSREAEILANGVLLKREKNPHAGRHASEMVEVTDGGAARWGIFKPTDGESIYTLQRIVARIPRRTFAVREAAASQLASAIGVPFVPPTVYREIDGRRGSLQLFIDDARRGQDVDAQLDRPSAEKLRVFDFLIGNSDRTPRNLMVRRDGDSWLPVAIDNANSFPSGHPLYFQWPFDQVESHTGPLLPETRAFIASIDPELVASVLLEAGIERGATMQALRRLARLKRDTSFLEVPSRGSRRLRMTRMMVRMTAAARSRTQRLSRAERRDIDRLVQKKFGPRNRTGIIVSTGLAAGVPGIGPNFSTEGGIAMRENPETGRRRFIGYGSGGVSFLFWGRKLVGNTLSRRPQVERKIAAAGVGVARNHPIFGDRISISPPLISIYASRSGGLGISVDIPPLVPIFGLPYPVARSVFSLYVSNPKLAGVSNRILDRTDKLAATVNRKLAPVKRKLAPVTSRLKKVKDRVVRRGDAPPTPTRIASAGRLRKSATTGPRSSHPPKQRHAAARRRSTMRPR
jgi:hypothetical protein